VPSIPAGELVARGETTRDGVEVVEDGKIVGREGPRKNVKVLGN
jgi:hypothetical protein